MLHFYHIERLKSTGFGKIIMSKKESFYPIMISIYSFLGRNVWGESSLIKV